MKHRKKSELCLLLVISLLCGDCARSSRNVRNPYDAKNNPDKFAWETLADIGRPAGNGSNDAVWETWVSQEDVYVKTGSPVFPASSHRPLVLHVPALLTPLAAPPVESAIPLPEDGKSQEVRMNRAAFDYIVASNLWNKQGQIAWFNNKKPVSFPKEAIEIKAQWKPISDWEKSRYHWNVDGGKNTLGLMALHITTKDLPNWFWATFEQVDNPNRCAINGCKDTFGLDTDKKPARQWLAFLRDNGMGQEWTNYRLTGSQIDFVESAGPTTRLGNSEIEGNFMECSSCISCHAQARLGSRGFAKFQHWVGTPNPDWFKENMQMDFVWSLNRAWLDGFIPDGSDCNGSRPRQ